MRRSTLWKAIQLDGDVFLEGFLGLSWFPSDDAKANRDRWEKAVDSIISSLSTHQTAWAIMMSLHETGHKVTIKPEREKDCNSTTTPGSKVTAARAGTAAEHCSNAIKGDNAGIGGGTDSEITFSPGHWVKNGGCSASGVGRDGDEILLHEICHAMRYAAGQRDACFETIAGMGDFEEFVAITLTNIFSSETKRPLRKDHEGFVQLPAMSRLYNKKGERQMVNLNDDKVFADWFRPQLENIKKYQPLLASRLKSYSTIQWNPFYYL